MRNSERSGSDSAHIVSTSLERDGPPPGLYDPQAGADLSQEVVRPLLAPGALPQHLL